MPETNFNPGGAYDTPDGRDYQWSNEEFGSALPPFDWEKGYDIEEELRTILGDSSFVLKPNHQGNSQSCGGQAWSKYAAVLNAVIEKKFTENSAKFIYAQTAIPGGGSQGRPNCDILHKQGCADEDLCLSYSDKQPPDESFITRLADITSEARSNAKFDQTLSYTTVPKTIEDFAHGLSNNHGMAIGIRGIWDTDSSWTKKYPQPPVGASVTWGHWIYAGKAKLVDGKKMIGLLNSWGEDTGDHGWQWIGEDYFSGNGIYIMGGWTHVLAERQVSSKSLTCNFSVNLSYGIKSDEVKLLQQALQLDGTLPLTVQTTGYFGPATLGAVQKFQEKYGIAIQGTPGYGMVGPKTREKLNELFDH